MIYICTEHNERRNITWLLGAVVSRLEHKGHCIYKLPSEKKIQLVHLIDSKDTKIEAKGEASKLTGLNSFAIL